VASEFGRFRDRDTGNREGLPDHVLVLGSRAFYSFLLPQLASDVCDSSTGNIGFADCSGGFRDDSGGEESQGAVRAG